jgi:hypothetical protein
MPVRSYAQKKRMYVTRACRKNRSRGQTLSGTKLLLLLAGASSRWSLVPEHAQQMQQPKHHSLTTAVPSAAYNHRAGAISHPHRAARCAASGNHRQYTGTGFSTVT